MQLRILYRCSRVGMLVEVPGYVARALGWFGIVKLQIYLKAFKRVVSLVGAAA
jgi:hypothetical protein